MKETSRMPCVCMSMSPGQIERPFASRLRTPASFQAGSAVQSAPTEAMRPPRTSTYPVGSTRVSEMTLPLKMRRSVCITSPRPRR